MAARDPLSVIVPIGRGERFDPDAFVRDHGEDPPIPDAPVESAGPHVDFSRGSCLVRWSGAIGVSFQFDRFTSERGELKAEVVVRSITPGLERQLHQARENLMSTRTRSELAKALAGKDHGQKHEWPDLVESAIAAAVAAFRNGEPAILLRDAPSRVTSRMALPPVVLGELPTFIFGRGGDGKSLLALAFGLALHTGRADIVGLTPATTLRVGYLDWEFSASEHRERMRALVGDEMPDLVYVRCSEAIWDEEDRLARVIREQRLEFVVIDSVGMACGGLPPETSEAALRFNSALRRLSIGALCVAHMVKDGGEEHPFGSIFWHNQARSTWLAKKQDPEFSSSGFVVGLFQKKANTGPLSAPLAFGVSFADDRIAITRGDVRDAPDLARTVSLRWRLQKALAGGPQLISDVAEDLDEKPDTVRRTLQRYDGKQFVRSSGPDGIDRWALLAAERGA
jgi:hypothetical protein